ncbi:VENN motif pre-toxin domain-containing protein [Erwinia persicina]|uniref:VENN motif pre-toxin domain-containing protein n=1 Tax=Erwinia persicina TaxID=55211 RepID=UPI0039AFD267
MQRAYDNAMRQYGTGSDLQKAAQAVTGALTALAGNNLAGALASGASPYLATEIRKLTTNPLTGKVDVASNAMAHAVLGAVTAQLNNQSAVAGGLGAGGGELAARYIAGQLFPGRAADQLSESEKQQVSALSELAAGLAGGLATGDTGGAVTAGQAGKNAVENNSLSGDKARAAVKESAEAMKAQVRETLGEGSLSQLVNGTINALADGGDSVLGSADYAADAAMALTACAIGDSYCTKAMSDLSGKNQTVADSVSALMNGDTWEGIKTLAQKANQGDQLALEGMGGLMAGILIPGKKIPDVGAVIVSDSVAFSAKQLDKKFKHAIDFDIVTTKKNPETLKQYETAIKSHLDDAATTENGTYGFVKDSKVFFNSNTNNAVVIDKSDEFITGFKVIPGTPQYDNYMKNGILR